MIDKYVGWLFNEDHYDTTCIPVNKQLEIDNLLFCF